ncbi:MAG: TetR/AcrR family transcriptional regulator [Desulfobacterales bacterium]|nr:MAG: TetR/AcrR family transcriptional regulator [Desulfobacterales bacterium]
MPKAAKAPRPLPKGHKIKSKALLERRQQQISEAAMKLFAQNGYHNTTVRDIARLSNISIGSVYDYVKNKEDILFLVSQKFFATLKENVEKALRGIDDPLMKLKATIEATLTVIDTFQEYVLITYRESKHFKKQDLIGIFRQESFFIDLFMNIFKEGNEKGVFRMNDPFLVANLMTLMTHCWALKRYSLREYSLFRFKEILIEFVMQGIVGQGTAIQEIGTEKAVQ